MSNDPIVTFWCGKKLSDLSKDELIAIIEQREKSTLTEIEALQKSRQMWMEDAFKLAAEKARS